MENQTTGPVDQQEASNKVEKKFNDNMQKLFVLFNGEKKVPGRRKTLPGKEVVGLVDEILEERQVAFKAEFKTKALAIIDSNIKFQAFKKEKEQELKTAITKKQEEFNKELEALFAMVDNIEAVRKEYIDVFTAAGGKVIDDTKPTEETK